VLRIATPLILGTLGVLLCERAGVLNLGIEGIMVAGAFAGWLAVFQGCRCGAGVAVAALTGMAFGSAARRADGDAGVVAACGSGLGITLLATSLASFAYRVSFPKVDSPPTIQPFAPMAGLPIPVLDAQTPLTLLACCWCRWWPGCCTARRWAWPAHGGREPGRGRRPGPERGRAAHGAVITGSALMGVAGAFLTLSAFNAFYFNMVNGRGWVCVALVVFASWRPGKALLGALLFAFFDALQLRLQQAGGGASGWNCRTRCT
jgi:ABC-type uncharacterized transport system permease subunit